MSNELKIAGVTFYLEDSSCVAGKKGTYVGHARLSAAVNDVDLWDRLLKQLNGMVLYRGSDMKTQIINVLQGKNQALEKSVGQIQDQMVDKVERAEQRASVAEADKVDLEKKVAELERELESAMEILMAAG